jgi:hypothetical protein
VAVELAQFEEKSIRCKNCGRHFTKYEEKETDVAIAVRLLESASQRFLSRIGLTPPSSSQGTRISPLPTGPLPGW